MSLLVDESSLVSTERRNTVSGIVIALVVVLG